MKLEPIEKIVGSVQLKHTQNKMYLAERLASGDIEGVKFEVCHGYGNAYVVFNNMIGSLSKIEVDFKDLVDAAYKIAKEQNLFK